MPGQEAIGPRTYAGTRITRAGNVRYEHDTAGRITLRHKTRLSRKPDTWRFTWDAEDRLTAVTTPDGARWRYLYDPLGRRTAKQRIAPDGVTVAEQVSFTWDGSTLCEETTTSADLPHPVVLTWDHSEMRPLAQTERPRPTSTTRTRRPTPSGSRPSSARTKRSRSTANRRTIRWANAFISARTAR